LHAPQLHCCEPNTWTNSIKIRVLFAVFLIKLGFLQARFDICLPILKSVKQLSVIFLRPTNVFPSIKMFQINNFGRN
jgi:hypothetical protein